MIPVTNKYPFWRGRTIALPTTDPVFREIFSIQKSTDWILNRMMVSWPEIGGANPLDFADLRFQLIDHARGKNLVSSRLSSAQFGGDAVDIELTSTPGPFRNFAGATGKKSNQQYLGSKSIDWFFNATSAFELVISNYLGAGNPLTLNVMFQGTSILKSGVLR